MKRQHHRGKETAARTTATTTTTTTTTTNIPKKKRKIDDDDDDDDGGKEKKSGNGVQGNKNTKKKKKVTKSLKNNSKAYAGKCKFCNCIFKNQVFLQIHEKNRLCSVGTRCDICGKLFKNKWNCSRHKNMNKKSCTAPRECEFCGTKYENNKNDVKHHVCSCKYCGKSFDVVGKRERRTHVIKCKNFYCCKYCGIRCKSPYETKNHEKKCRPPLSKSCEYCGKFFKKKQKLELHEKTCRVYNCKYCNIRYKNKSRVKHHEKMCEKKNFRDYMENTTFLPTVQASGYRRKHSIIAKCAKCGLEIKQFNKDKLFFHKCKREKPALNNFKEVSFTKKNAVGHCFKCGKVFPELHMLYYHVRNDHCQRKKQKSIKRKTKEDRNPKNRYFKCLICHKHYEMYSIMQRHLQHHRYNGEKLMRGGSGGGGNSGGSSGTAPGSSTSVANDDIRTEKLDPEKWGWSEIQLQLDLTTFQSAEIEKLLLTEIRNETFRRKAMFGKNNDEGDYDADSSENDEGAENESLSRDQATLSVIAVMTVWFNKMLTPSPSSTSSGDISAEEPTLVDAYFTSAPVRLLRGNVRDDIRFMVENFQDQISEYTSLKSGMTLALIEKIDLSFYHYKGLIGGSVGESLFYLLPSELYLRGKVINITYNHIEQAVKNEMHPAYVHSCFHHVILAHEFLKMGNKVTNIPTRLDECGAIVSDSYMELSIQSLLELDKSKEILKKFDWSVCRNEGKPMYLEDVRQFCKANADKIKVNLFQLERKTTDQKLFNKRPEFVSVRRNYVITQYYVSEQEDKNNADIVNILFWNETQHYYLISNLRSLILFVNKHPKVIDSRDRLCYYCLNLIACRYNSMSEHVKMCKQNKKQYVQYPIRGKNDVEKFKNYRLMNKLQIFVAADIECSIISIKPPSSENLMDSFGGKSKTFSIKMNYAAYEHLSKKETFPLRYTDKLVPTQIHRVNSIAWYLYVDPEIRYFPHEDFREKVGNMKNYLVAKGDSEKDEEHVLDLFMNWLNLAAKYIKSWLVEINSKDVQRQVLRNLKKQDNVKKMMNSETKCRYCKSDLLANDIQLQNDDGLINLDHIEQDNDDNDNDDDDDDDDDAVAVVVVDDDDDE